MRFLFCLLFVVFISCCKEITELNIIGNYSCVKNSTIYTGNVGNGIDTVIQIDSITIKINKVGDTIYEAKIGDGNSLGYLKILNDSIYEYPFNPISYIRGKFSNDYKNLLFMYGYESITIREVSHCNCTKQ